MIEIKNEFKLKDEVYLIYNDKVEYGFIYGIDVSVKQNFNYSCIREYSYDMFNIQKATLDIPKIELWYDVMLIHPNKIMTKCLIRKLHPNKLFKTKEDLIKLILKE